MVTNVTYWDIAYKDPCEPVNQLPTMSGGITGSFVSGGITYKYHTWGTNDSFETGSAGSDCTGSAGIFRVENLGNICTVQLLVVAGGGGGGANGGIGGGAGQVVYVPNFPLRTTRYCCKRGSGGNGAATSGDPSQNGGDSIFYLDLFPYRPSISSPQDYPFSIIAKGGGGTTGSAATSNIRGNNGGSGAGGSTVSIPNENQITASCDTTGSAIYNTSLYYYGNNGGCGISVKATGSISHGAGGGGGATNSGSNATATLANWGSATGGNGGDGIALTMISSSAIYYAGGGGGGGQTSLNGTAFGGSGGLGGGGNGGSRTGLIEATTGSAFTGGGGGGGRGWVSLSGPGGAAGGSGTIIITYKYQLD